MCLIKTSDSPAFAVRPHVSFRLLFHEHVLALPYVRGLFDAGIILIGVVEFYRNIGIGGIWNTDSLGAVRN